MPFLHVTTHIEGRKDEQLFGQKGGTGFPTFMFLDPRGGVLAKQPGALDIARMTELHDKAKARRDAYLELQKKAEGGDEKAKGKLEVWDLEMGIMTLADFRKAHPDLSKLDEDARMTVLGLIGDDALMRANQTLMKIVGQDRSKIPEGAKAAAPIILEAVKLGAEPSDDRTRISYYFILALGGDNLGNAEMLKLAIAALEDDAESNPRLGSEVEKWKARLKDIEAGGAGESKDDSADEEEMPEDEGTDDEGTEEEPE